MDDILGKWAEACGNGANFDYLPPSGVLIPFWNYRGVKGLKMRLAVWGFWNIWGCGATGARLSEVRRVGKGYGQIGELRGLNRLFLNRNPSHGYSRGKPMHNMNQ